MAEMKHWNLAGLEVPTADSEEDSLCGRTDSLYSTKEVEGGCSEGIVHLVLAQHAVLWHTVDPGLSAAVWRVSGATSGSF